MNAENLLILNLRGNRIGSQGFDFLTKAKWNKITSLNISNHIYTKGNNQIRDEGCFYLANT